MTDRMPIEHSDTERDEADIRRASEKLWWADRCSEAGETRAPDRGRASKTTSGTMVHTDECIAPWEAMVAAFSRLS